MTPREQYEALRAMSPEAMQDRALRQAPDMVNAPLRPGLTMLNANAARFPREQVEPKPAPLTRWQRFVRWLSA